MQKKLLFHFVVIIFMLSILSCKGSESDEGDTVATYIIISSEGGNEKLLGKTFTFKVKDNLNHDITTMTEIYINGQLINGNQYTPPEKGVYTVNAKYQELPVNPILVNALINEGINFKHRILYEDFTGTWCGNCTRAGARAKNLALQTDDGFVFMGVHGPSGQDPWSNTTSTELELFKNVTGADLGWPTMFINRNTMWEDTENYTDMSVPLSQLKAFSKVGIKIGSVVSGNLLNINAQISFAQDFTGLKIAAFMVEDELVGKQKNYIPALGPPTIYDYVHHNILRNRLTSSIAGENIPGNETVISNEYSRSFQFSIPTDYNRNHLKVIVMILDGSGSVLNVREEKIGITNNYEFL
ncbi:Omp28-related outer membrane protein [Chryseobacterium sp. Tr-659]|uniref:Omp28-related outer membrane protein n=1 Tax=Chryseobacterium sp. Tr-659 TaxID=2608340 RepID=UPI001422CBBA|nr:Omp28-related outer membrane protein [Chryseobacterium sp. Tr-659]NIF07808.1 Omp28-related outer membrane protein [Chryseobacterium sp. Tr-659]